MTKLRIDASVDKAAPVLERFAALVTQIALVQAARDERIAGANADADRALKPLVDEAAEIKLQVQPWWERHGAQLLPAKRKTMELGGCIIGGKAGRSNLQFAGGDDVAALAALQECKWAKPYIRVSYAVNKTATASGLTGKHAAVLKELGFSKPAAAELFVLEPITQAGTMQVAK